MQRLKDEFFEKVEARVALRGLNALEIGCGDGKRSEQLATLCSSVVGIEPNEESLKIAKERNIANAQFMPGAGQNLPFKNDSFDIVFFTLSLHHVPINLMDLAISEAVRAVRADGHIVFLEPAEEGSFFEAELHFGIGDGDERKEKAAAYAAILSHPKLRDREEIDDEALFHYDSLEDFNETSFPIKNQPELKDFLDTNKYILRATRRIIIAQPAKN